MPTFKIQTVFTVCICLCTVTFKATFTSSYKHLEIKTTTDEFTLMKTITIDPLLAQQAQICSQLWKYTPATQKLSSTKRSTFFFLLPFLLFWIISLLNSYEWHQVIGLCNGISQGYGYISYLISGWSESCMQSIHRLTEWLRKGP